MKKKLTFKYQFKNPFEYGGFRIYPLSIYLTESYGHFIIFNMTVHYYYESK